MTNEAKAFRLLESMARIRRNDAISLANQGQPMDGFSQLHNYNAVADDIIEFLEGVTRCREEDHIINTYPGY